MSAKPNKLRLTQPSLKPGTHISAPEATDTVTPRWCFSNLRSGWDTSCLQKDEKVLFLDHLVRRSHLTWKEIKIQPRTKLGYESISGDSIKGGIPTLASGEVIFCFRMGDGGRFLGVRKDDTFHIIWIDCKFELYKHAKG